MPTSAQQLLAKEHIAVRKRRSTKECERCLRRHARQSAVEPDEPACDFGRSRSAKCSYCRKVGKPCLVIDTSKSTKDRKLYKVQQVRADIVELGGDPAARRESVSRARRIARRFASELSKERSQRKDISELGQIILELRAMREVFEKLLWTHKAAHHLIDWDDPTAEDDEFSDFDEDDVSDEDVEEAEEEETPPEPASVAPVAGPSRAVSAPPAPARARPKGILRKKSSKKLRSKAAARNLAPAAESSDNRPTFEIADDDMDIDDNGGVEEGGEQVVE